MKKALLSLATVLIGTFCIATTHTISISGSSFSPNDLTVNQGDTVIINATSNHPTVRVSETTWNSSGSAELSGGWGSKTATFNFVASTIEIVYYVCANHVAGGMKGKITVVANTGTGIENEENTKAHIFPNPTINNWFNVNVNNEKAKSLEIYSLDGKRVENYRVKKGLNNINTTATKGNYIYVIKSEQQILDKGRLTIN